MFQSKELSLIISPSKNRITKELGVIGTSPIHHYTQTI